MSNRSYWFRFVASVFALTLVSALAIAAIGPRYYPSLFTTSANENLAVVPALATPVTIGTCDTAGPVEVESSGGTTTPTAYPTLNDAFLAIIAGTHTGSINIEICGNTTETASATLTASGVGSASYTDVTIRPVGGARVIEGTITGAIIRLNGADNVTIDGRQGGTGTARDLTVRNNSTATATAAVWLSSVAAGNGAANNVIRNLEIACGVDTTTSGNTSVGILMAGTTVSVTANGVDNDNNQFIFNRVIRARYGIVTRGTTTDLNANPVVTDNIVGPTAFGADQIAKTGIFMQADTGANVSRNTVQYVGCLEPQACTGTDRNGIAIGTESWSSTDTTSLTSLNYTITKNVIHDVVEENTFSAAGIRVGTTQSGGATNNLVVNNFVYNIRANGTGGDQFVGIGISAGNGDRVEFNSISITGDMDPGAAALSTQYGNAIRIPGANGTNNANFSIRNNSIYLDASSATATVHHYAITLNSAAYTFGTGGLNYNNYYINAANTQLRTGGLSTTTGGAATTEFQTLANWQGALTAPQDVNSIQADPLYFSNTSDIHIQTASPNINVGLTIAGIADDIDGQVRPNGANPDIGADEFYPSAGSVQFSSAAYSVTEVGLTVTITATRTGGANGAVSIDYASVAGGSATGGAACTAGVDYINTSGTLNWADLDFASKTFNVTVCNDGVPEGSETVNLALSNPMGGVTLGTPNAAVLTILNSTTFGASVNVGTAEGITSLTNSGGLFDQINTGALTANLTANITSDLTAETGAVALNQFSGGFTLTIQPSGASRTISGANSTVLIDINGADNVHFLCNAGGALDTLIRNTGVGTGTVIRFINDASNNTVQVCTLEGGGTSSVLFISTGVTTGNDNISINQNIIRDRTDATSVPFNSINLIGSSAAIANSNINIHNNRLINFTQAGIVVGNSEGVSFVGNEIFQTASRTTSLFGVAVNSAFGTNVFSQNDVHDLTTTLGATGLQFNDARDTTVSRNRIFNFPSTSGSTGTLSGIVFNGSSGNPAALTVVNNMVSIQPAFTNAQTIRGMFDFAFGGNTFTAHYNSILVSGTGSGASSTWACVRGTGAPTAFTSSNNICFNNRTGGTGNHFAMGDQSNATGTVTSNFNIFVGTGAVAANFFDRGTVSGGTPVDFAAWQAGGRDANSQASNPGGNYTVANMFVSPSDLHLANEGTNPASNTGTPVAGITTDFDGNARSATTPEIGFDEFFVAVPGTLAFSSATYNVGEAGPTVTLTVNRTGGTDGAVSVDFALAGGSATGGAACGGAVDYVNTGGTLSFANGDASETFDVAICNDAVFEGNETFVATLSNPTGGATIGSPNPATVTINDNELQPTVQFSSATYMVTEALVDNGGAPVATITATLSGPSQGTVTVDFATVAGGTATGGASCTVGVDYVNASGTLTFTGGDVSETFGVQTCADVTDESDETVNLALTNPMGATLGMPNTAVLTIIDNDGAAAPVTVTATMGTTGPTPYNTLKEAFDAINAGTHQGAITVLINQNTTETAPAVLNASGAPSAYTSVLVRPTATATVAGNFAGGVIRLNGADNVTIDGRIGGMGTGRDLTVRNNSTATATAAIWLSSLGAGAGATNNTIRNLEIAAGATAFDNSNVTVGIIMSGAAVSTTSDGNDNDNNSFIANRITRARYGIISRGAAANNNEGLVITDNIVGPNAFGPDEIGKVGIYVQADTGALVSRNTVQFVGGTFATTLAGTDRCGICIGNENWGQTEATVITSGDYTVTRNVVHDVVDERTFSAAGIRLGTTRAGAATNNLVANNFIYNIRTNGTAGDQPVGIGYAAGHTDRIVFNSISMTGDMDPPGGPVNATIYGNAMRVSTVNGTNNVNLTMMNNSIYMDVNSNTAANHYYAITLPSAAYVFGTGGLNFNNYYVNQANAQMRTGGLGVTSGNTPGAEFQTLANWQMALTVPQDPNSIQADPLYFSNTVDLHIQPASPNINAGTAITGIVEDIDAQVRPNGPNPDIGADEFYPGAGTVQLDSSSYSIAETGGSLTVTVLRLGGANGAASVQYATGGGTATSGASCAPGVDYVSASGTLNWADLDAAPKTFMVQICPDGVIENAETFNVTLSNPMTVTLGSPSSAVATIRDSGSTVTGTINVGAGETITSLTNPSGIFDVINNGTVTGNTTINITSDLSGETGAVQLNEFASPFTITIKPSGAARTVSGTSSATGGLLGFNATDRVTIDGSLSGGTDRSLTINNLITTNAGGVIYFAAGANGAQNNTVKNTNIWGQGATTGSLLGIAFANTTFGGVGQDHDNNRIENNDIRGAFYGIAVLGLSAANPNVGTVVTRNVMPATGAAGIGRVGMYIFADDGGVFTENTIASVSSATAVDCIGMAMGNQNITLNPTTGDVTNATIARNSIGVVSNTATNSSVGIVLASGTAGTNNVVNNMVSGVIGNADVVSAATNDLVAGILIIPRAGATQNVYHNSVSMTGDRGTTNNQAPSFALAITADLATNVVNNILLNTQTRGGTGGGGESYAIGFDGPAANANLMSNFNDLFVSGAQGQVGITGDLTTAAQTPTAGTGTNRTTLLDWQTATSEDANSFSVDPLFVSLTDLHLQAMSPMINAGTNVGVTIDFDGDTRVPPFEIGADEVPGAPAPGQLQFSSATYTVGEAGPTATITVNRVNGSDGTVTVQYATVAGGTATGGAACTAGIDYQTIPPTTLTFLNGETSKTFTVTICQDPTDEPDETVNLALSNPTGGGTIGMPGTAVLTIVDDDAPPMNFTVAISDARITEGNAGMANMTFNVTLTAVAPPLEGGVTIASVQYATANGTATAGSDYTASMGTLNFEAPGTLPVSVPILGDVAKEANEFFFVNLSMPSPNTTITDGQGAGVIVDNDRPYVADFDRDLKADVSVFRPTTDLWYILQSADSTMRIASTGPSSDIAVPGDYDGDGKTDVANFQRKSTTWFVLRSTDSTITTTSWGLSTDKPVQGDYDGDGRADIAIFRPSTGQWWVIRSSNGSTFVSQFGISTDRPVQGDYDGDARTDIAVYRDGVWYISRSSDGVVVISNWGLASDRPVSGDFDGDGRFDLAIYRNGQWWTQNSLAGTFTVQNYGLSTDIPAPADYDGDGTTDLAVFRPSSGDWYILRSTDGSSMGPHWGVAGDVPIPAAYLPQ